MADEEAQPTRLQVANARPEDSGRGLAHLPRSLMTKEDDEAPLSLVSICP